MKLNHFFDGILLYIILTHTVIKKHHWLPHLIQWFHRYPIESYDNIKNRLHASINLETNERWMIMTHAWLHYNKLFSDQSIYPQSIQECIYLWSSQIKLKQNMGICPMFELKPSTFLHSSFNIHTVCHQLVWKRATNEASKPHRLQQRKNNWHYQINPNRTHLTISLALNLS